MEHLTRYRESLLNNSSLRTNFETRLVLTGLVAEAEIVRLGQRSYYSVNAGGESMSSQLSPNTAQLLQALEASGLRSEPFIERLKGSSSPSGSLWPSGSSPVPSPPGTPRGSIPSRPSGTSDPPREVLPSKEGILFLREGGLRSPLSPAGGRSCYPPSLREGLVSFSPSTTQAGELAIRLRNSHRSQGRLPRNQRQVLRGGEPCHDSTR